MNDECESECDYDDDETDDETDDDSVPAPPRSAPPPARGRGTVMPTDLSFIRNSLSDLT